MIWFVVGYAAFSLLFLTWWARGLPPAERFTLPQQDFEGTQGFVPAIPLSGSAKSDELPC